jgi:hypothetical protein
MTAAATEAVSPAPGTAASGPSLDLLARAFNAAPNGFALVGRDGLSCGWK